MKTKKRFKLRTICGENIIVAEGIENIDDESRCLGMSATYLQGFKYSKPIPIGQFREFLDKNS